MLKRKYIGLIGLLFLLLIGLTIYLKVGNTIKLSTGARIKYIGKNEKGFNEYINLKDSTILIYIPSGEFLMGQNDSSGIPRGESPQHKVYLDGYFISKYPITVRQFKRFCAETGYKTEAEKDGWVYIYDNGWVRKKGLNYIHPFASDKFVDDNTPAVNISWNDAVAYCRWAKLRLPTEAEWEKAARGDKGYIFPWGNDLPDGTKANFADENALGVSPWADTLVDDGYKFTSPVGNYAAGISPYGCFDMAGNVCEWCSDVYDENYYSISPYKNPRGPECGKFNVLENDSIIAACGKYYVTKGGSWWNNEITLRSSFRGHAEANTKNIYLGFRVAGDMRMPVTYRLYLPINIKILKWKLRFSLLDVSITVDR